VYISRPETLQQAFCSYDEGVGMTIESEELASAAVEAQGDLLEAFSAVRSTGAVPTWAAAFDLVFGVLFWSTADGRRHRDAPWAESCGMVDSYLSPETVVRLAQQAATIHLDDVNLALTEFSGEGWIQDFNDFRGMAQEWLDLLASAAERRQALAIAVWD
jgi:hypothetical protein